MFGTRNITIANGNKTRFFDREGDKNCIVFVYGLANSIEIWEGVLPDLSNEFRVVVFDIPGFSLANRSEADYDSFFYGIIGCLHGCHGHYPQREQPEAFIAAVKNHLLSEREETKS